MPDSSRCDTLWGSHGCSKLPGHVEGGDPDHVCDYEPDSGLGCCSVRWTGVENVGVKRYYEQDGSLSEPYDTLLFSLTADGQFPSDPMHYVDQRGESDGVEVAG